MLELRLNNTSRMSREAHVRFCERLRGETPLCLLGVAPKGFLRNKKTYVPWDFAAWYLAERPQVPGTVGNLSRFHYFETISLCGEYST